MSSRVSARRVPQTLLEAKAAVCDAYRAWLEDTTRDNRTRLCVALRCVHELESCPPPSPEAA